MTAIKKLERIQKRALRFVLEDFTSDYDTLLTNANTDTILISRLKLVAIELYKCINAINVPYLNYMFKVKENKLGLRHQKNVVQSRSNTIKYGKNSFSYIGSHIWNMLPCYFQTAENINVFKRLVKTWEGPKCKCILCYNMPQGI